MAAFCPVEAQITITNSDMPNVNDTVRLSVLQTLTGFDQNLTGANYNWDYSFLATDSQRVERFVSPGSTGYPFIVGFLSTYAKTNHNPDLLPFALLGSAPTNVYDFYKKQASSLTISVQGVTTTGIALPIILSPADVIYKFPLQYGNIDSSNSGYANAVPGFGYFAKKQKRVNIVDGWGTLKTPNKTFNTLRVKSVITVTDSIYFDSLGFGINLPLPTVYEFKWLAQGRKLPVLEINALGTFLGSGLIVTNVMFQDSTGVGSTDDIIVNINIPNGFTPDGDGVNDYWNIRALDEHKKCKVEVFNQWGSIIFSSTGYKSPWDGTYNGQPVEAGTYYYNIDLNNGYDVYNGSITIIK